MTREEDNELRRLSFFQQVGALSDHRRERFNELRLRDRPKEIRPSGVRQRDGRRRPDRAASMVAVQEPLSNAPTRAVLSDREEGPSSRGDLAR